MQMASSHLASTQTRTGVCRWEGDAMIPVIWMELTRLAKQDAERVGRPRIARAREDRRRGRR